LVVASSVAVLVIAVGLWKVTGAAWLEAAIKEAAIMDRPIMLHLIGRIRFLRLSIVFMFVCFVFLVLDLSRRHGGSLLRCARIQPDAFSVFPGWPDRLP
jgi:hypothetical protein